MPPWATMIEFLVDRYPHIGEEVWRERMARGDVVDGKGVPFQPGSPYVKGARLWYYRDLPPEPVRTVRVHRGTRGLMIAPQLRRARGSPAHQDLQSLVAHAPAENAVRARERRQAPRRALRRAPRRRNAVLTRSPTASRERASFCGSTTTRSIP